MGVLSFMASLTKDMLNDECIRHACEVRKAILSNDYRAFFKLYRKAPNMSAYLMDFYADKMRRQALEIMLAAYRPSVPVDYLNELLVV